MFGVKAYGREIRLGTADFEGCGRDSGNGWLERALGGRIGAVVEGPDSPDLERAASQACVAGFAIDTLLYCCGCG